MTFWMAAFFIFALARLTITRAEMGATSSMTSRPFSLSVVPVSTMSTIASASSSSGASSTEPSILMVSHLSDRGFWDVCGLTDRPFVATHSDSRALCRNSRNLTDEQFAEIAQRGGLVGINLYTPFLVRQSDSVLDDAIDHIERFIGMYGEKIVALGCDFDGCDQLPVGIEGLGDMYRLADRMLALGYREETVRGLFYDNAFAFIQKML